MRMTGQKGFFNGIVSSHFRSDRHLVKFLVKVSCHIRESCCASCILSIRPRDISRCQVLRPISCPPLIPSQRH